MNEAETRAELIDKQLEVVGWKTDLTTGVRVRREYAINAGAIKASGVRAKKLIADYVLEYHHIKLAVIEAKSNELDVSEGVMQAKVYAKKLRLNTSFATNGKSIYQIDLKNHQEGKITQFPSPQALWKHTFGETDNNWLSRFNNVAFEDMNGTRQARYYQELAVNRVMKAIANEQQRILLTLATGTGKTFIAFQIAWKLFQAKWNQQKNGKRRPRILFLADRNILANQAYLNFSAFDEDALIRINPKEIAKRGQVPKNGSVFFTIFQTFMSGKDDTPYFGDYPADFFDLVIIDECHRGGASDESSWREILNYFSPAVHLGLTATPKREGNTDTYQYFGEPIFTYSLKEGIEDGFLTPFKVKRVQTTIDEYHYTADDEVIDGEVETGRIYQESDFNRHIIIEARERKRVQEMFKLINHQEKTLVFCADQAHAGMIRDLINQEAVKPHIDYCVRVTANDKAQGEMYLEQFKDNDRSIPTILTTSRKLSTGVDALNVRNIVLLRPVKSMIEFKQIIGRGTRLFEGKYYFTVLDFVGAYHLFNDPQWDGEPLDQTSTAEPLSVREKEATYDRDDDQDDTEKPLKTKIRIKLSDGKVRELQSMVSTHYHVDGQMISAEEFLQWLFDQVKLPALLESEEKLRQLWSNPMTRIELLEKLQNHGCSSEDLRHLQHLIQAEDSDLFDVLEYIAYAKPPLTRVQRVTESQGKIYNLLNDNQREFVKYVLSNYVETGIEELSVCNLSTILTAKYGSLDAAQKALGEIVEIKQTFVDFQQYLYAGNEHG